jgi:succinate-semialdehyde dehydrogenase/glutarate-semialdehyde dehydrogenase
MLRFLSTRIINTMAANFKLSDTSLLCETGWINGRAAKAASGRAPFAVHDPATDEIWAHSESMDDKDTDIAIAAAHAAFPAWSKTPARKRARLLLELDRLFREAKEDLKQIITMETGKALVEADGEVEYAGEFHIGVAHTVATYSWLLAGECERIQGEMITHGENSNMRFILTKQPLGPVGLLTP